MSDTIPLTLQTVIAVDRAGFERAKAAGLNEDAMSDLLDDVDDENVEVSVIEPDGTRTIVAVSEEPS